MALKPFDDEVVARAMDANFTRERLALLSRQRRAGCAIDLFVTLVYICLMIFDAHHRLVTSLCVFVFLLLSFIGYIVIGREMRHLQIIEAIVARLRKP